MIPGWLRAAWGAIIRRGVVLVMGILTVLSWTSWWRRRRERAQVARTDSLLDRARDDTLPVTQGDAEALRARWEKELEAKVAAIRQEGEAERDAIRRKFGGGK